MKQEGFVMHPNNELIHNLLREKAVSLVGFADLSEVDPSARFGMQYGISIAVHAEPA